MPKVIKPFLYNCKGIINLDQVTRSLGRHSWSIWNLKMITFNILLIDATSFYHTATSPAPTSFRQFWRTRGDETPTSSCIGGLENVNGIELLSMRIGDALVDRRLNARGLKQRVEGRFLVIQELNLHQNHIPCPLCLWPPHWNGKDEAGVTS